MSRTNGQSDEWHEALDEDTTCTSAKLRDASDGNFFWLSNAILDSDKYSELTSTDIAILCAIAYHIYDEAQGCYPSRKSIGDLARCAEATVSRSVKKMERLGLVRVERREASTNRYWLLNPERETGATDGSRNFNRAHYTDMRSRSDDLTSGVDEIKSSGHTSRSGGDDITTPKEHTQTKTAQNKRGLKNRLSSTTCVREANPSLSGFFLGQDDASSCVNTRHKQMEVEPSVDAPVSEHTSENRISSSGKGGSRSLQSGDTDKRVKSFLQMLQAHLPQSDLDNHLPRLEADLRDLCQRLPEEISDSKSLREKVQSVVYATFGTDRWNELDAADREAVTLLFKELYQSTEWRLGGSPWIVPFASFSIAAHLDGKQEITPSHIRKVAAKILKDEQDSFYESSPSKSRSRKPEGIEEVVDLAIEIMKQGDLSKERWTSPGLVDVSSLWN